MPVAVNIRNGRVGQAVAVKISRVRRKTGPAELIQTTAKVGIS